MIILHKKHILAGTLGAILVVAGYINYKSQPIDISGNITDNVNDAQFVVNMKETIENVDAKNSNMSDAYFVSAKLEKEDTYDKQVKYHEEIMYNENSDEATKTMAQSEINNIVEKMSVEMIIESLLEAKGFSDVLALINDDNVNIVVKTPEELNISQVAQIQNVVMREANVKSENIHIITKS